MQGSRRQAHGKQGGARNGSALPSQTSRDGAQGTARQEPRYFYGQEQTRTAGRGQEYRNDSRRYSGQDGRSASDLAAGGWIQGGHGLDTSWIQEPDEGVGGVLRVLRGTISVGEDREPDRAAP